MRIGVLGTGRIGLMHARNLAQTTGVDEVVLMGRDPARLAVSVRQVCATLRPDAPSELAGNLAPHRQPATVSAGAGLTEELAALDGVVVATSTATHPAFALQIARAEAFHVSRRAGKVTGDSTTGTTRRHTEWRTRTGCRTRVAPR